MTEHPIFRAPKIPKVPRVFKPPRLTGWAYARPGWEPVWVRRVRSLLIHCPIVPLVASYLRDAAPDLVVDPSTSSRWRGTILDFARAKGGHIPGVTIWTVRCRTVGQRFFRIEAPLHLATVPALDAEALARLLPEYFGIEIKEGSLRRWEPEPDKPRLSYWTRRTPPERHGRRAPDVRVAAIRARKHGLAGVQALIDLLEAKRRQEEAKEKWKQASNENAKRKRSGAKKRNYS